MVENHVFERLNRLKDKLEKLLIFTSGQKSLSKLKKTLSKLMDGLSEIVEVFWTSRIKLAEREKILEKAHRFLDPIYNTLKLLYRENYLDHNTIMKATVMFSNLGAFDLAHRLLEETLWRNKNFSNLATIADIGYESGLLDESIKALDTLEEMGFSFFELYYNKALVLYMVGCDDKSLEIINRLEKNYVNRFTFKKTIIGLKVAALIANNEIDKAKKESMLRRED